MDCNLKIKSKLKGVIRITFNATHNILMIIENVLILKYCNILKH